MKFYILQVLIAFDQLVNALLGGWADETLSSRSYRSWQRKEKFGIIFKNLIDLLALLFNDKNHCEQAFISEREDRQEPPELRNS